ncbi:MAG: hypothetical protein ACREHE_11955 [Rhizomicrobium sp.]
MKDIVVIGGSNGAGKTTAARTLLGEKIEVAEFINADEIARALSPRDTEAAAIALAASFEGRSRYPAGRDCAALSRRNRQHAEVVPTSGGCGCNIR